MSWEPVEGLQGLSAALPLNRHSIARPADASRLYHLLASPTPSLFSDDFESGAAGWTTFVNDENGATVSGSWVDSVGIHRTHRGSR